VGWFSIPSIRKDDAGLPAYVSATPAGILELFHRYNLETSGNTVLSLEKQYCRQASANVLSLKAKSGDATVTVLVTARQKILNNISLQADILMLLWEVRFVTGDMVKEALLLWMWVQPVFLALKQKSGYR